MGHQKSISLNLPPMAGIILKDKTSNTCKIELNTTKDKIENGNLSSKHGMLSGGKSRRLGRCSGRFAEISE